MTLHPNCAAALGNRTEAQKKAPFGEPFLHLAGCLRQRDAAPVPVFAFAGCVCSGKESMTAQALGQRKAALVQREPPAPCKNSKKALLKRRAFSFNFVLLLSAAAQYGCPDTLPLQRSGGLPFQSRRSGCFQTRKRFWLPCTGARKNTGPRRWYPAHRRRHIPR